MKGNSISNNASTMRLIRILHDVPTHIILGIGNSIMQ